MSATHVGKSAKNTHQLRPAQDDLQDNLPREGFVPEPTLDSVQDFSVHRVVFGKQVLELQVRGAEAVRKVLREDPAAV